MRVSGIAATLSLVVACGRTPLLGTKAHDAAAPSQDAASDSDATPKAADAALDTPRPETRPYRPDASPPLTCSVLASLAGRGVLTPRHAKQVLFSKDRSSLVLRVSGTDASAGDEVMVVRLPGGETSYLGAGAVDINWIDAGQQVLLRNSADDLVASSLDGVDTRILIRGTCEHRTGPDGFRVLAFGDCNASSASLAALDPHIGMRTNLGRIARKAHSFAANAAFSPNGKWFAYIEPSPAADGSVSYDGTVRVVDSNYNAYNLKSAPGASNPHFASDEVLLFTTRASEPNVDVRAHVLGSGDTSRVIARGVSLCSEFDNNVSPDGQWILAAIVPLPSLRPSYALSAFSLDGREVALAGDLFPFWTTEMVWHSFAFAADNRHVVYLTAGSPSGTVVVGSAGGEAASLSSNPFFVIPPTGNLVALTETRSTPLRVRLTNLDTQKDAAVAETTTNPTNVTFTPNGASVIFVEEALRSTPARLQHLSGHTGVVTALAQWNLNQLAPSYDPCCNQPEPGYPIDPTGCFTVVDSDLEGGTRLVLLPE